LFYSLDFPSVTIPKVIFYIHNDPDALFSYYQISVDGIRDLQLIELASRKGSQDFVAGLAKYIESDSSVERGTQGLIILKGRYKTNIYIYKYCISILAQYSPNTI
jgi:hypothetical protein